MVCNAATNAVAFKYSGGDAGVSKMISNGRGRTLWRRGQNAVERVANNSVARGEAVNDWKLIHAAKIFQRSASAGSIKCFVNVAPRTMP